MFDRQCHQWRESMRKLLVVAVVSLLVSSAGGQNGDKAGHADADHVVLRPDDLKWGPAPPGLPAGAQIAVLAGDPSKTGMPFTMRAKMPDGYKVPAHWHSS